MTPWQKEGGLGMNHSGVLFWFMALCAGSNEKGIGHFMIFPKLCVYRWDIVGVKVVSAVYHTTIRTELRN